MGKMRKKVISVMLSAAMISTALPYGNLSAGETMMSEAVPAETQPQTQALPAETQGLAAPQAESQQPEPQTQEQTQSPETPGAAAVSEPAQALPGTENVIEPDTQGVPTSEAQPQEEKKTEKEGDGIEIETESLLPYLQYNFDDMSVRVSHPDDKPFSHDNSFSVITVSDMFNGDKEEMEKHYEKVMDISASAYLNKAGQLASDEDNKNEFKKSIKSFTHLIPNYINAGGAETLKYTITYEDAADYSLIKEKKETPVVFTYDSTFKVGIIEGNDLKVDLKDDGKTYELSFTDTSSDTFAVSLLSSAYLSSINSQKEEIKEEIKETEAPAAESEKQTDEETEADEKEKTETEDETETEEEKTTETNASAETEEKKETEEETEKEVAGITATAVGLEDGAEVKAEEITDEKTLSKIKELIGSGATIIKPLDITASGDMINPDDGAEITLSGITLENQKAVLFHIADFDTEDPTVEKLEYTYDASTHTAKFTTHSFSPFVFALQAPVRRSLIRRAPGKTLDEFTASIYDGASRIKNASGGTDYVWDAPVDTTEKNHGFIYRITFSLSGESFYKPGEVQMTLPKRMLKDRSGKYADTYELSVPAEGSNTGDFVYKEDGDNIVIYNRTEVPAADNGYIEIMYSTSEETYEYADYGKAASSDTFKAQIKAGAKTQTISAPPVHINTKAYVTSATKYSPERYSTWQSEWGTAPSDANNYFYLVWEVSSDITANGKYNFTLTDNFQKYGKVLGFKPQESMTFSHEEPYTTIASAPGTASITLKNQADTYEYGRYIEILTALSKADYENLLKTQLISGISGSHDTINDTSYGYYEVFNTSTSKVKHVDGVDKETTANAAEKYRYEEPHFIYPTGLFWSDKWGYDYYNNYAYSSEDIRLYGDVVKPFKRGDTKKLSSFKYHIFTRGYPYPWTIEDGANPKDGDNYGKKPVTYTLEDSKLILGSTELKDADYNITQFDLNPEYSEVKYNKETYAFDDATVNNTNDRIDIYIKKSLAGNYSKVATYNVAANTFTITDRAAVSSTSGKTIKFNDGVKGVQFITSNAHYYTCVGADMYVSLNNTSTVLNYIKSNTDLISLYNTNTANTKDYKGNTIVTFSHTAPNYATAATTKSSITKRVKSYKNDLANKAVNITWTASVYEMTATTHKYVTQGEGTFYDLLPLGADYKNNSVVVKTDGKIISDSDFTVRTTSNYKDSGRTLLVVKINNPADEYDIQYVSTYPWDSIHDFGKNVRNTIAYETGNADIGDGSPDDGGNLTYDKELMRGFDPQAAGKEKFIYSQRSMSLSVPTSALLGLYKKVKASKDSTYSRETSVRQNEEYTYKIRFATDANTEAKDLILFDSLENFKTRDGKTSDWRGTYTGIDLSQARALGINPVVYYSTSPALRTVVPKTESSGSGKDYAWGDLSYKYNGQSVWTTEKPKNASDITGIAIDLRTSVNGTKYTFPKDSAVTVIVSMKAPGVFTGSKQDPVTYNNIYLYSTVKQTTESAAGAQSTTENTELNHQDYTIVHLLYRKFGDVNILKVSSKDNTPIEDIAFTLKGKSVYGTNVNLTKKTGKHGTIIFKDIERGTYTLQETTVTPDFLEYHALINVRIADDGSTQLIKKDASGKETVAAETGNVRQDSGTKRLIITNKPRVHGNFTFMKKDSVTNRLITGASFKLSGTSDYGNDILMYASSESGKVLFENVEKGKYTLTETKTADGYIFPLTNTWEVVGNENGLFGIANLKQASNGEYVITNEPYHKLSLLKISAYDGSQLKGAEFKLSGTSDYGTQVDKTAVSDGSGFAKFDMLEPGTYVLEETKAPTATIVVNADKTTSEDTTMKYRCDTTKRAVRVNADGTTEVEGLKDDGAGNIMVPNQRIPTDTVVVTKKWKDGLTGEAAENRPYPNIHIESYKGVNSH